MPTSPEAVRPSSGSALHPELTAVAIDAGSGAFETMNTLAPPVGRGWEYLQGVGWDWESELAALPELLREKLQAPSVEPGSYDLVIGPSNLWLTIHESVGHATELDRALGYEANYAGMSFATYDQLGTLRYGSELMHVTGDRDGRARALHGRLGRRGCRRAALGPRQGRDAGRLPARPVDGGAQGLLRAPTAAPTPTRPGHVQIQRMANVSLQPAADGPSTESLIAGVERGLYPEFEAEENTALS